MLDIQEYHTLTGKSNDLLGFYQNSAMLKRDMTPNELIEFCKKVLINFDYTVVDNLID